MEVKKFEDAGGNPITVLEYNGRLYPDFPRDAIRGIETFRAREDDVVINAYPKCGTHWVWEMVRTLQAGTVDLPVMEKDDIMIEFIPPDDLEKFPSPRALNTHVHFECYPPDLLKKRCKIIYVTRDPRDAAVSYYNHHKKLEKYYHYEGQWKDYLPLFLEGKVDYESWFAYTKSWEQGIKNHPELPVHITSYEALHANTLGEIKKMAAFLGVKNTDESFLNSVVKQSNFDTMSVTKGSLLTDSRDGTSVMYRKGKVGDWKNWFTVAQSEQFNAVFEQEMAGTDAYELYSHTKQKQGIPDKNMNEQA